MTGVGMVVAAIVLLRGLYAANHMCRKTALPVRAAWVLLTVGAAAVLLQGGASV